MGLKDSKCHPFCQCLEGLEPFIFKAGSSPVSSLQGTARVFNHAGQASSLHGKAGCFFFGKARQDVSSSAVKARLRDFERASRCAASDPNLSSLYRQYRVSFGHQDIAYRILCREHRELAERLSNAFDSGYAYVQGKRTFELTYKNSPRLLVVNTPHENTVKVSHWIRDFMLDVERQRATELFRLVASESPGYNETMEATREIARETIESTQEVNRECTQEMHETMEVGENPMVDEENGIAARPDPMGDEENGIAAGQNQMSDEENGIAAGQNEMGDEENGIAVGQNEMGDEENGIAVGQDENAAGWENLFQVVNESAFKNYFNNVQDLGESFMQLPQTIHITRSLNPRIMVVVPDE
ncbi:uncharacterized protein TNCV_1985941 [Trichonephila clavipes]|nr:uncharacterized protein TNCV_1985941 [Trichonephila clavipes]